MIFRENLNSCNHSTERYETVMREYIAENLTKAKSDGTHHCYLDLHEKRQKNPILMESLTQGV